MFRIPSAVVCASGFDARRSSSEDWRWERCPDALRHLHQIGRRTLGNDRYAFVSGARPDLNRGLSLAVNANQVRPPNG